MTPPESRLARTGDARKKLLEASIKLVRQHGFAATSVDQLCREAGVTKGAFFHHFESKEALGVEATNHWTEFTDDLFERADYNRLKDPLDRFLGYLDFRESLLDLPIEDFSCFTGTTVQETFASSDPIRSACDASISRHVARLAVDLDAAIAKYGAPKGVTGESLGFLSQAVLQGAFILAKAQGDSTAARECVAHLRRYTLMIFSKSKRAPRKGPARG